jgi:hypothetical protein
MDLGRPRSRIITTEQTQGLMARHLESHASIDQNLRRHALLFPQQA